jgi:hypothetical protein
VHPDREFRLRRRIAGSKHVHVETIFGERHADVLPNTDAWPSKLLLLATVPEINQASYLGRILHSGRVHRVPWSTESQVA